MRNRVIKEILKDIEAQLGKSLVGLESYFWNGNRILFLDTEEKNMEFELILERATTIRDSNVFEWRFISKNILENEFEIYEGKSTLMKKGDIKVC